MIAYFLRVPKSVPPERIFSTSGYAGHSLRKHPSNVRVTFSVVAGCANTGSEWGVEGAERKEGRCRSSSSGTATVFDGGGIRKEQRVLTAAQYVQ